MEKECCNKKNLINFSGKVSDLFQIFIEGQELPSNLGVPSNLNLGRGGDYVDFSYCSNCGQMDGKFPLDLTKQKE